MKESDIPEEVKCPWCGATQSDMGRNVACEECGEGPMPSPSADVVLSKKARKVNGR